MRSLAHSSVFCSFWQFRVQTVATAMNATGGVQRTRHRTHAHFSSFRTLARQMWWHIWLKGFTAQGIWAIHCVSSQNCFVSSHVFVECFFDTIFLLFSLHLLDHWRHLLLLLRCRLEQDQTPVLLRSGVGRPVDPIPNTGYEPRFCVW